MLDYKKVIHSRDARIRFLQLLNWVPDKWMLSLQYRITTGRKLNWSNPERFTEKLQLYKVRSRDSMLMAQCADKWEVRKYVESKGLSDILVPVIGVYDSVDEIHWDSLPDRFVLKDTLGCGGNAVIVCTDKSHFDLESAKNQCAEWTRFHCRHPGREHVYDHGKHRIIIEEYLNPLSEETGLVDFKFFCFNGVPAYVYAISNREMGKGAELGIYDSAFNRLPYFRKDERRPKRMIPKPANYEKMLLIAQKLSEDFPEARIDLYNKEGKIYFGEITFFDGSGYMSFEPDAFDYELGRQFKLGNK